MFSKILIANRGAIACRIIRTLDAMGIKSVAVYSDADRHSRHVRLAGEAVRIGPPTAAHSYLNIEAIIAAAKATGAEAIHPGYGFLSENTAFADACKAAGITFIGPEPDHIRAFALKHTARELAEKAGVPLAPGSGLVADADAALSEARRIGFPVMLKSTAGGGGIGLQLVESEDDLLPTFERVQRLAANNFKDAGVFVEKFVARGRHIEVQIFGDGKGRVLALGERDCSAQRRNQKVLEETPAPGLPAETRKRLLETAIKLGQVVNYANAGTVEYLFDTDSGQFYFLEVNTRLQVEHGVTEEVTGIDLVAWMVRQAAGEPLPDVMSEPAGASIQVRVYAEDPARDFRPSSGLLTKVAWPEGVRVETWVESGTEVSSYYDPMIAKVIVTAHDRPAALAKLRAALAATTLAGIETNLGYLGMLAASDVVAEGQVTTATLANVHYAPATLEILSPGTLTSIQDYPGRIGYWSVGVPPSGPMDHLSFRLANRAVGNAEGAAAFELTLSGPQIRFNCATTIALVGADMQATLDGVAIANGTPHTVTAGQVLTCGAILGAGLRTYLAVRGGLDVPDYLGSKSTFSLGKFGGHGGRTLRSGDVLHLAAERDAQTSPPQVRVPSGLMPELTDAWEIGVLYGPHGAPDFFTPDDIDTIFSASWEVHYNSNRTGVRLIGPKPKWARADGGEAGLHPSNIHDNAYAIGAIDFTGDMPVILGPDGPSLGGFVCPATIVQAELWKIGQLKPGDRVRFRRVSQQEAVLLEAAQNRAVAALEPVGALPPLPAVSALKDDCIVAVRKETAEAPRVTYRRAGDKYLLVEYGPIVLDFELRFRAHVLMTRLEALELSGIIDLTPGIRSLQIHYDGRVLALDALMAALARIEDAIGDIGDIAVPSRIVHMPLSWNDVSVQKTIDKYMQSVRADAPWCPSNIEFIRRINGLESLDDVYRVIFDAHYLVLGLGDVYLGAPVATPIDPRHRLVTTKYNPARTWTPDNVVGIGGAYMCIYGMEGPGGYQLFGRTCQVWNSFRQTASFTDGKPWLLRFFDQVKFYPVSAEELERIRDGVIDGTVQIATTETVFSMKAYREMLDENRDAIAAAKARQQAAFDAERARWQAADQMAAAPVADIAPDDSEAIPPGSFAVESTVPGSVWKIAVDVGARVAAGDVVVIVESMKMEMAVVAPCAGTIGELRCQEGKAVALGQALLIMTADAAEAAQ
ncbi:MAG: urea carboxylase [Hyphomicrobium sp.]